jgi:photoactive yellow protein
MLNFSDPQLYDELERLSASELDALEIGVVQMDPAGTVTAYNQTEARLSGLTSEQVVGKNFFNQVAPCTNNYLVAHRFVGEPVLDATIDYVFTLKMRPTKVQLRMLAHPDRVHHYLIVVKRT